MGRCTPELLIWYGGSSSVLSGTGSTEVEKDESGESEEAEAGGRRWQGGSTCRRRRRLGLVPLCRSQFPMTVEGYIVLAADRRSQAWAATRLRCGRELGRGLALIVYQLVVDALATFFRDFLHTGELACLVAPLMLSPYRLLRIDVIASGDADVCQTWGVTCSLSSMPSQVDLRISNMECNTPAELYDYDGYGRFTCIMNPEDQIHQYFKWSKTLGWDPGWQPTSELNKDVALNDELETFDSMSQTGAIASVLIATVTFAAAFTVPGGYIADTGAPTLAKRFSFKAFVLFDILAFLLSTIATISLTYGGTSFIHQRVRRRYHTFSWTLLSRGSECMLAAFAFGVHLLLPSPADRWIVVAVGLLAVASVMFIDWGDWWWVVAVKPTWIRAGWRGLLAMKGMFVVLYQRASKISFMAITTFGLLLLLNRPGTSSGILLGAITLPSVMLSRLIQLARVLPEDPNASQEFAYLEMQYWTASVSCLGVLVFFLWHLQHSSSNKISKALVYASSLVVLYLVTCFLSFLQKADGGWLSATSMLHLVCHGLADVIFTKHIQRNSNGGCK